MKKHKNILEIENCQINEDENTVTGYSAKLIYTIAAKDIERKIGYLNIVLYRHV